MRPNLTWCALLGAALSACGPDANGAAPNTTNNGVDQTNGETVSAPPGVQLPAGLFVIEQLDVRGECVDARVPLVGDLARIGAEGATVTFGGFALAASDDQGNFAGCDAEPASEGAPTTRYQRTEASVTQTAAGLTVSLALDEVFNGREGACKGFDLTLRPQGECDAMGTFEAASQTIASGTCDFSWAPATVTLSSSAGTKLVDWGGVEFESAFDAASCTITATRGVSSGTNFDVWSYNGATREVELELVLAANDATATIQDAAIGQTMQGESCAGATFSVALTRVTGLDDELQPPPVDCAVERPPICGNGMCELGETCAQCEEDCGCAMGETCTPGGSDGYACRAACEDVTIPGQCGAGNRCGVLREPSFVIQPSDTTYCVPSAGREEGEVCERLSDCVDGLICHRSRHSVGSLGVCSQPCGQCDDGYICEEAGGGSGSYPAAVRGCARACTMFDDSACSEPDLVCSDLGSYMEPSCIARAASTEGVGADCSTEACGPGLACFFDECVMLCDVTGDCAETGGTCSTEGSIGVCYGG